MWVDECGCVCVHRHVCVYVCLSFLLYLYFSYFLFSYFRKKTVPLIAAGKGNATATVTGKNIELD